MGMGAESKKADLNEQIGFDLLILIIRTNQLVSTSYLTLIYGLGG